MAFCISLSEISKNDMNLCGPKAHNLSILAANGFSVPDGLCIIKTGNILHVDGDLGIVTIEKR